MYGYANPDVNAAPGHGDLEIVICPAMLAVPRTPKPGSGAPGRVNLGRAFLRTTWLLRTMDTVWHPPLKDLDFIDANLWILNRDTGWNSQAIEQSHTLLKEGWMGNADNHAQMATWGNDLGVGFQKNAMLQCLMSGLRSIHSFLTSHAICRSLFWGLAL